MGPTGNGAPESHRGGVSERAGELWSGTQPVLVDVAPAQLVVFTLDGRELALHVEDVSEVLRMVAVTPLPEASGYVAGVINLRGRIVPVIDLRVRLGMAPREQDSSTPIIIVGGGEGAAGLVADGVVEVLSLPSEAVEPPSRLSAPVVSGVAREDDRLIVVLDPDRLCEGYAHLRLPIDGDQTREADR